MTLVFVRDGQVVTTRLPASSQRNDGRTVSNYDRLPEQALREDGWLPVDDPSPPAHDPDTEQVVRDGYEVGKDEVTIRYRVEPIPERSPETQGVEPLTDDEITRLRALLDAE